MITVESLSYTASLLPAGRIDLNVVASLYTYYENALSRRNSRLAYQLDSEIPIIVTESALLRRREICAWPDWFDHVDAAYFTRRFMNAPPPSIVLQDADGYGLEGRYSFTTGRPDGRLPEGAERYGKERQFCTATTAACYQLNRRAQVALRR